MSPDYYQVPAIIASSNYEHEAAEDFEPASRSGLCFPGLAIVGGQPPRIKDACGAASGGRTSGPVLDPDRPPAQYGSYAGKQDQRGQYPTPVNRHPAAKLQVLQA
jgi:hypothetical protein